MSTVADVAHYTSIGSETETRLQFINNHPTREDLNLPIQTTSLVKPTPIIIDGVQRGNMVPVLVGTRLEKGESSKRKKGSEKKKDVILFKQIWSDRDELLLAKSLLRYVAEKRDNPLNDVARFHDYLKRAGLRGNFTHDQVSNKIYRMCNKFLRAAMKEIRKGKKKVFTNKHNEKVFRLSHKIWDLQGNMIGLDGGARMQVVDHHAADVVASTPVRVVHEQVTSASDIAPVITTTTSGVGSSSGHRTWKIPKFTGAGEFGLQPEALNMGLEMVADSKKEQLEAMWEELRLEEARLFEKRLDLFRFQATMSYEALTSKGV